MEYKGRSPHYLMQFIRTKKGERRVLIYKREREKEATITEYGEEKGLDVELNTSSEAALKHRQHYERNTMFYISVRSPMMSYVHSLACLELGVRIGSAYPSELFSDDQVEPNENGIDFIAVEGRGGLKNRNHHNLALHRGVQLLRKVRFLKKRSI